MTIEFFPEDQVNEDIITTLMEQHIEIYVQPTDMRHKQEGFNKTDLIMTWELVRVENGLVEIQLLFKNPDFISPSIE